MSVDNFRLDGKVALVTGGNSGLGRAIALGLRDAGASVTAAGRDPAKNAALQQELGPAHLSVSLDVRSTGSVDAAVAMVLERFGRLDILVNNAGNFVGGVLANVDIGGWQSVLDTHLVGAVRCSRTAVPAMVNGGHGGKIINISSIYAIFGPPDFSDYAAAKSGLLGLTRALAVELAPQDIQVNAVLPGWYETPMTAGLPATELGEQIRAKTPAGRWGRFDDLIGPVVFLASPASRFVTGTALPVDGGYSIADRLIF